MRTSFSTRMPTPAGRAVAAMLVREVAQGRMLSARLQMRQSQSLVMTPQLLQSIRLLQFSHLELQSFVEGEVERNPLLTHGEDAGARPQPGEDFAFAREGASDRGEAILLRAAGPEQALTGARQDGAALADGFSGAGDASPAERRAERALSAGPAGGSPGRVEGGTVEDLADERRSLAAHALAEVRDAFSDPVERAVAEQFAAELDEAGYLRIEPAAFAAALGLRPERLLALLRRLQDAAEPAGLFALDLADCLAIQLRRKDRLDPVMASVLSRLDLLARRDFAALRALTGEDEASLADMLAEIRHLDPKPGHGFDAAGPAAVVPDVTVAEAQDGSWRVELNPEALPRVLMETAYVARIATGRLSREEQSFLAECQASANWLVRSLDQRARTILKVASEIVRRQDEFLAKGVSGLRPMTLMGVAEALGLHESTVSRVTANKFIATPRGTFEMKFFFTNAIASSTGGEAHSALSVKHRIRALVDGEAAEGVLSDDDIVARLKAEGVELARRTVAKYREVLGIPSSVQRRREMNARRLAS